MKNENLKFFISCNLDFSEELEKELHEMWPKLLDISGKANLLPLKIVDKDPAGILIEAPLYLGLQINLFSKISNRVLLRLAEFTAKDFPKVYQRINALKKNPLVFDAAKLGFEFEVACSNSRLNNEKRVLEMLAEIFPFGKKPKQKLFVRIHQDVCTVSIDSSGANLYLRSARVEQGEASLRETLAAFCARKLTEGLTSKELENITLIDPMVGSGTMLLEASKLLQITDRTDFAFLDWPQTPKLFKTALFRKNYPAFPLLFKELIGKDTDTEMLKLCKNRLKTQALPFSVLKQDVMEKLSTPAKGPCFLISNAPYGERLKADFTPAELLSTLIQAYQPQRVGLLFKNTQGKPSEPVGKGETMKAYKLLSKSAFLNGGLRVSFHVFSRFG
jgi:putative N6-adenine-specific DNA methylase